MTVLAVESWASFLYGLGMGFAIAGMVLGLVALHYVRKALHR